MKATNDTVSTHVGRCIQRTKVTAYSRFLRAACCRYYSTVRALSIPNSNAQMAAAAITLQENNKCIQFWRCLHQTAQ